MYLAPSSSIDLLLTDRTIECGEPTQPQAIIHPRAWFKDFNSVSHAHNFRVRLFNADPEQQRLRDMVKDSYRRELQQQMMADKMRKEQEKKKIEEQDLKYEREFYDKIKIQATTNQKKDQQPYFIMRSREKNRGKKPKPSGVSDSVLNPQMSTLQKLPMTSLANPEYPASHEYSAPTPTQLPPLTINRQTRDNSERVLNEYSYEDQRLSSIHYFQEAILRKMDSLKTEIQAPRIDRNREIEKIRHLLYDQAHIVPIQYAEEMDLYEFHKRKRNVMANRSYVYNARDKTNSANIRKHSEELDYEQLLDRVQILPVKHPRRQQIN